MKTNYSIVSLTICGVLALSAGCGKNDSADTAPKTMPPAAKTEIAPSATPAEQPMPAPTNAAVVPTAPAPAVQTPAAATTTSDSVLDKANLGQSLGGLGNAVGASSWDKNSMDVDAYVTNKALDGLFLMVANEERQIRQNPVARTTDMLQKVFGSLKN